MSIILKRVLPHIFIEEITPNLGIGDIILWKMYELSSNIIIKKIKIRLSVISMYRLNSENYTEFLKSFLYIIFPKAVLEFTEETNYTPLPVNLINKVYIYDHCKLLTNLDDNNYIVIHTKARFDYDSNIFYSVHLDKIKSKLNNIKFKYKVMLLGEKETVEQNVETIQHGIISIYSDIKESLGKNNEILDMTRNDLYSGNSITSFEQDISKINNAKLNIVFGYGGPLTLSVAFSKKTIGFVCGLINHNVLQKYSEFPEVFLYSELDSFLKKLEEYSVMT